MTTLESEVNVEPVDALDASVAVSGHDAEVALVESLTMAERTRVRRKARRSAYLRRCLVLLIGVGAILAWQWASDTGRIHRFIAPSPADIADYLPKLITGSYFLSNLSITLQEIIIGFVIGMACGFGLGLLVSVSSFSRAVLNPYVLALNAPPGIVFAPLFLTWFGFGMTSKIMMAVAGAFFPIFMNTVAGLAEARNAEAEKLMRSFTASRRQVFFKVLLPNAMPLIFAGIKLCWTSATTGVVVAEFLGASAGIGFMIQSFNFQLDIPGVFSLILLLSVFTAVVYWLLEQAERKCFTWGRLV